MYNHSDSEKGEGFVFKAARLEKSLAKEIILQSKYLESSLLALHSCVTFTTEHFHTCVFLMDLADTFSPSLPS